ncbi:MAG: ABC transporter permease [Anaerolineales bacterium]|nr:ABC transporter permease [Anaerolineales bacterium]
MRTYLIRRLLLSALFVLTTTVIAFASIQFVPADVVNLILGKRETPEARAALEHRLGLDQPPVKQYFRWLGGVLCGDLGQSLRTQEVVTDMLRQRLPVTIELALLSILVAMGIGIPAGLIAAIRQYSFIDRVSTVISMLGVSMPHFWMATLMILGFSVTWMILPPAGILPSLFENPLGNLKRMVMPSLAIGLPTTAVFFRMTRSSMLEVIHSGYITTAHSKGLNERKVILGHALKNAIIPVITVLGLEFTWMLGGSFVIETIFTLPGLGRLIVNAIRMRDFTVLQGGLLVYSLLVAAISLLIDLAYAWLDPRIRY